MYIECKILFYLLIDFVLFNIMYRVFVDIIMRTNDSDLLKTLINKAKLKVYLIKL